MTTKHQAMEEVTRVANEIHGTTQLSWREAIADKMTRGYAILVAIDEVAKGRGFSLRQREAITEIAATAYVAGMNKITETADKLLQTLK